MKPSVLVVEDETPIRVGLCDVLVFHGMAPTQAADGPSGLAEALTGRHALILLDVMLPGMDGITICRRVREALPTQPILLLTARGAESDILQGFDAGADDYVTKPFSVAQLMARVQSLLRRAGKVAPSRFQLGDIAVDGSTLRAERDDDAVELTARDVELLAFMSSRRGQVVSREELLTEVWGFARVERVETRCIDMHVAKLRKKLAQVGAEELIATVRGMGYRCD